MQPPYVEGLKLVQGDWECSLVLHTGVHSMQQQLHQNGWDEDNEGDMGNLSTLPLFSVAVKPACAVGADNT